MRDLGRYLISVNCTVRDTIQVIDQGAAQIALVTDNTRYLLGTVTDGDIRRALLRGLSLDCSVDQVMQRLFRALPDSASEEEALELMRREVLHQIPAVDGQGRVVRLFLLEDLLKPKTLPNPVILMAGGEGKRLGQLTKDCPKPMLRVGGRPLLQIILEQCIAAGFRDFYIAVNYLRHQIQEFFSDGGRWNVSIRYIEEDQPLGTAGALSLLPERYPYPLLVINADVLTRVDFTHLLRFHTEHGSAATLCVREHATQIPYGVVRTEDIRVLMLEEKPVLNHYVNAGIYLVNPEVLDLLPQGCFYDMPQLLEQVLHREHRVTAFPIHEYWLDVGLPETFERAKGDWR